MSHDNNNSESKSIKSSYMSSILFMLLLAFLFISAVNFVDIMSHDEGHGGGHATEHADATHHDVGHGDESHHEGEAHEEGHH